MDIVQLENKVSKLTDFERWKMFARDAISIIDRDESNLDAVRKIASKAFSSLARELAATFETIECNEDAANDIGIPNLIDRLLSFDPDFPNFNEISEYAILGYRDDIPRDIPVLHFIGDESEFQIYCTQLNYICDTLAILDRKGD